MYYLDLTDLQHIIDDIFGVYTSSSKQPQATKSTPVNPKNFNSNQPKVFGYWCLEIKRVPFNGNTTIVWFQDDTYAIVNCSSGDKYDRKTAIAYAMVKRMLGKVGKYDKQAKKFNAKEIDGNGFGCYLQKIVDNAFDQEKEEKLALEKKRTAKTEHEARQTAQKKAAFDRRVEERAKQILLERAAIDRANEIEDYNREHACNKKNNTCDFFHTNCSCNAADSILDTYVRPDKPFSKFTPEEKRKYWKYQNAKKRSKRA